MGDHVASIKGVVAMLIPLDRGRVGANGLPGWCVMRVHDEGATSARRGNIFGCSTWAFGAADCDEEPERCLRALAACCEDTLGGHRGYSVRRFAGAVACTSRGATAPIAMRIAAQVRPIVTITCPHRTSSPA